MHPQVNDFIERVKRMYPTKFINADVLDVGSMDINGNNRHHFYQSRYLGVDIADGPNVDAVCDPQEPFPYGMGSFDTIISTECMEHNKYFRETISKMISSLRPGGLLLMTMAGHLRPEHGTHKSDPAASIHTLDYYRNLYVSDLSKVDYKGGVPIEELFMPLCIEYGGAYDLYFYGIKR